MDPPKRPSIKIRHNGLVTEKWQVKSNGYTGSGRKNEKYICMFHVSHHKLFTKSITFSTSIKECCALNKQHQSVLGKLQVSL
jgi:hypothetical protein